MAVKIASLLLEEEVGSHSRPAATGFGFGHFSAESLSLSLPFFFPLGGSTASRGQFTKTLLWTPTRF